MNNIENLKNELYKIASDIRKIEEAQAITSYEVTAVAPVGAAKRRGQVLGYLAKERINKINDPKMKEIINSLSEKDIYNNLDDFTAAMVRKYKMEMDKFNSIPSELYQEYVAVKVQAEAVWQEAKYRNDYESYKPYLKQVIDYNNKFIDLWGYEDDRYNAFLKYQEPKLTVKEIDKIFNKIKDSTVSLIKKIREKGNDIDDSFSFKVYDKNKQRLFSQHLLDEICFDKKRGVLCEVEHPYTAFINRDDVRVATHFYDTNIMPGIYSTLHEGGHALYEQNIDPKYTDCILSGGINGSLHEASSRFWENMIGRNPNFWKGEMPFLKMIFPNELEGISAEDMYRASNKMSNSMLRIRADELTYNLHIIIRYELEKDIFNGKLDFEELPYMWDKKTEDYLGFKPTDMNTGLMQDVHWASGLFGYFHSYSLGNVCGAQFAHAFKKEHDNFDELIKNRQFGEILDWLREKWYRHGNFLTGDDLIKNVCGESINPDYLCKYLESKYSDLYNL